MKVLIRREIDEMLSSSLRESLVIYSIFSVGMILLSLVLGPKVFGFVNVEKTNGVFAVIIFMLINGCLDFNLKEDTENRQMTFLQTLPIRKTQIVWAKFAGMLILFGFALIWMAVIVSANLLINDVWTVESWMLVCIFLSFFLFMMAAKLVCYFMWGYRSVHFVFIVALVIWGAVIVSLHARLKSIGLLNVSFWLATLAGSAVVYLICWGVSWLRIKKNGFSGGIYLSEESHQADDGKEEEMA